jgi:hypothetical protein
VKDRSEQFNFMCINWSHTGFLNALYFSIYRSQNWKNYWNKQRSYLLSHIFKCTIHKSEKPRVSLILPRMLSFLNLLLMELPSYSPTHMRPWHHIQSLVE